MKRFPTAKPPAGWNWTWETGLEAIYEASGQDGERARPRPLSELRRRVGMVFQTPNVLPVSVARNLALPLQVVAGIPAPEIQRRMQRALVDVRLWDEVADRLDIPAERLSGGQQQRLCLARALALEPARAFAGRAHGLARRTRRHRY